MIHSVMFLSPSVAGLLMTDPPKHTPCRCLTLPGVVAWELMLYSTTHYQYKNLRPQTVFQPDF
jgi:hypothetical protein